MKISISIASDHAGFILKEALVTLLRQSDYTLLDRGCSSTDPVDYPDFARKVVEDIGSQKANYGILICATGLGMCIAANKHKQIRATFAYNEDSTVYSRLHNDANVLCFGGKYHTAYMAAKLLKLFTNTAFEGDRHNERLRKLELKKD